jgi:SAM-dependent methyltransferase
VGRENCSAHPTAFDALAAEYDVAFTYTPLGQALRSLVWRRLDERFRDVHHALDLGCGTGEDALRLAQRGITVQAVDSSESMIRVARGKAECAGCAARIEWRCEPLESFCDATVPALTGATPACDGVEPSPDEVTPPFDGVVSNFGALNCVADLSQLVRHIAARVRSGGPLIWVLMGRHVPWEWLWYLSRGAPAKAWRRLQPGGVSWRGMKIRYPTPAQLVQLLQPHFVIDRIAPLGIALPPSYAATWLNHSPRSLRALTWLERRAQGSAFLARFSDHFMIEATRRSCESAL